jgi:hypothetical protein
VFRKNRGSCSEAQAAIAAPAPDGEEDTREPLDNAPFGRVRASLFVALSSQLHGARDLRRDTPVARLVPYEGGFQAWLPVRKATATLRDVELPAPLERDVGSLEALAEERQAGR